MQNTSSLLLSTGSPKKTGAVSSIKIYLHDHMSKSSIYLQKAKKEITSWYLVNRRPWSYYRAEDIPWALAELKDAKADYWWVLILKAFSSNGGCVKWQAACGNIYCWLISTPNIGCLSTWFWFQRSTEKWLQSTKLRLVQQVIFLSQRLWSALSLLMM